MAAATIEGIEAALFAALEGLKRSADTPGPFVMVDRYAGEVTVAGVEATTMTKAPAALLAFEESAPVGTDGAYVDTILHDTQAVERTIWRVYVSVMDPRGPAAAQNGTVGQAGVLRCVRYVKEALVGLRIPGLHNDDVVRFVNHKPWSIKRGAHYAHVVRVSTVSATDGADDATPEGSTPLDEMGGTNGPPGNEFAPSTITF